MDKLLEAELITIVQHAVRSAMEESEEKWLSKEQLQQQFAFATDWYLRNNSIPRIKIGGQYYYPLHKINRYITNQAE